LRRKRKHLCKRHLVLVLVLVLDSSYLTCRATAQRRRVLAGRPAVVARASRLRVRATSPSRVPGLRFRLGGPSFGRPSRPRRKRRHGGRRAIFQSDFSYRGQSTCYRMSQLHLYVKKKFRRFRPPGIRPLHPLGSRFPAKPWPDHGLAIHRSGAKAGNSRPLRLGAISRSTRHLQIALLRVGRTSAWRYPRSGGSAGIRWLRSGTTSRSTRQLQIVLLRVADPRSVI
jgi:hypothetical protein